MDASSHAVPKHLHREDARFEQTVLLLQGGGALGSYQAGVYQALAEANLDPDWVAGISIGAVNAAIIAGNPPEKRIERLREFWEAVSTSPLGIPYFASMSIPDDGARSLLNQTRALQRSIWKASVSRRVRLSSTHCSGVLETMPPSQ
jgi:NTE family protein